MLRFMCLLYLFAVAVSVDPGGENATAAADDILLKLFDDTAGFRWGNRTGWIVSSDVCTYHGVSCYPEDTPDQQRAGHIQHIDLTDNHLVGTVPGVLFTLPYVESLVFRGNGDLHVDFSQIGQAQFLKELVLSDTAVRSLEGIEAAVALEYLHITNLGLEGPFATQLFQLLNLKGLYANYNNWVGTLPKEIGNWAHLEDLYLLENEMTGTIATTIGNLQYLKALNLAQNAWNGTIPSELEQCTSLEILAIYRQQGREKGPGIAGALPSLAKMSSIQQVYLQNQRLSGQIPTNFMENAPKENLIKVDLSSNDLSGGIPTGLADKVRVDIYLADNSISLPSSDFCNLVGGWMGGSVASVGCNAILCPAGTFTSLGRATKAVPCQSCATAAAAGVTTCPAAAGGPVDERSILMELYDSAGGIYWQSAANWTSSNGICSWEGISCDNGSVSAINLRNRGLTGAAPASLFGLSNLRVLDLSYNSISFDFSATGAATSLEVLDLTQSDITTLLGIGSLSATRISKLSVPSNHISESLPVDIFNLASLEELDISNNRFGGSLPGNIASLVNLKRLRCSEANLSGPFPTEVGSLVSLVEIICSENAFTGVLATELNNLVALERLSLSQVYSVNSIGGSLPAYRDLQQLVSLQLRGHSLSGPLPDAFLANTRRGSDRIEISISDNLFTGAIPSSWSSRFTRLFVDLTGNRLSGFGDGVCSQSGWMDGTVGGLSCAAILCPVGTFNEFGRQSSSDAACESCSQAEYLGTKFCADHPSDGTVTILADLYYATQGDTWLVNDGWMTTSGYCNWHGIGCNVAGQVVSINLEANGLQGTPPSSVFDLPALSELNFARNQIAFSFTGISQATSLVSLDLSGTNLDSVSGLDGATTLSELHLTDNDLAGSMPSEIFGLKSLRVLKLSFNQLEGRIPDDISALQILEELYLFGNRLSGQLPAALGSLIKLRICSLSENNFDGSLPPEFDDLVSLEVLAIQREGGTNESAGNVGVKQEMSEDTGLGLTGALLSFSKLTALRELYLGVNSFTSIPNNFLDGIADKAAPIEIDLISNHLVGDLPASLIRFEQMRLYVAGNRISGIPSGLCSRSEWMGGAVASFQCNGILCPPDTFSVYGRQADSVSSCTACPSGSSAPYYGSFECISAGQQNVSDERAVLEDLYRSTGGESWKSNQNWMDQDLSVCLWEGVSCSDYGAVESIELTRNGLIGTVGGSIYQLSSLKEINFAGNDIEISFAGIANAATLEYVNLDSTRQRSLSGIDEAPGIKLLHVVDNELVSFPTQVLSLSNLEVLYLSDNPIGSLPSTLENLGNLVTFACSRCALSGTLYDSFGSLSRLEYLSLDRNAYQGLIPASLQRLTLLKELDLSNQLLSSGHGGTPGEVNIGGAAGFNGPLPSFAQHAQLTGLYLQNNNLSSTLPYDFLQSADTNALVTVNLRGNSISGPLSSSLSRFQTFNMYIAENMITEVPSELCSLQWNGKTSVNSSNCDFILCPVGEITGLGRATDSIACTACPLPSDSPFMGGTTCGQDLEREILDQLYLELGGSRWVNSYGWSTGQLPCERFGVTCESGLVKALDLRANDLVGTITTRIWLLTRMASLDLSENPVDLSFQLIGDAEALKILKLSQTDVRSLASIGGATGLEELHLASCDILGPIPNELYDLTELKTLNLNYNKLNGTLPTLIGQLRNLEELYLFSNELSQVLPAGYFGAARLMRILSLGKNLWTGEIPGELPYLPFLEVLSLESKKTDQDPFISVNAGLIGNLPAFDHNSKLRELYLRGNALGSTIPSTFLAGVINKTDEIHVDLSDNAIEGPIPSTLADFPNLRLLLADNQISEVPTEICAMSNWMDGLVASGCDAVLCPPGTYNQFGRRLKSEDCHACDYRGVTEYYGSVFCGAILPQILSERAILAELFDGSGGHSWTDRTGWMDDSASICTWKGIGCGKSSDGREVVTEIDLSSNNVVGPIPSIVFYLKFLKSLNVSGNEVTLSFRDIGHSDTLEELDFSSTNVESLEGIGKVTNLKVLRMSGTPFYEQTIPDELYSLKHLTTLDISHSGFIGKLSSSIGELQNLEEFFCVNNDLSSELPTTIGNLNQLKTLRLSDCNFFGTMPSTIEDLLSIETLAIDARTRKTAGLSGKLPAFSKMPDLKYLDLGSNSLSGTISDDFLDEVETAGGTISVYLDSNVLSGTMPANLARFLRLNIDVSDNELTGIAEGLCSKSQWWDGDVGKYNCSGLLCPVGTFSALGRRSSDAGQCDVCPGSDSSFLGRTTCASLQKARAREILVKFYDATGGPNWRNRDGWRTESDMCAWYGITCNDDEIESIVLGANNLAGVPPKDIFELPGLTYLWLYSNPIDFSFEGIEKATSLTSLQLDSIGLSSLDGIGSAPALIDVDVRFNNLQGTLSDEIGKLSNLETFLCGDNRLSSNLPTFSWNRRLKAFRAGNNLFQGPLPSFNAHPNLVSVDISNNMLTGAIPDDLLVITDASKPVFIDLSLNDLTSTVPGSLSRFSQVAIYLRDNKVEGISPDLCKEGLWNEGDVGVFGCDGILCPPRTHSSTGRASQGKSQCRPCNSASYFGASECGSAYRHHSGAQPSLGLFATLLCFALALVVLV